MANGRLGTTCDFELEWESIIRINGIRFQNRLRLKRNLRHFPLNVHPAAHFFSAWNTRKECGLSVTA